MMSEQRFGAEAIAELTKAPIADIYNGLKNYSKIAYSKFFEDFSKYSNFMYRKCSIVRTLYSKTEPRYLDDVYVSTTFWRPGCPEVSNIDLEKEFSSGRRIIIKGNGGSGKTFFIKWLWLRRFAVENGKIPILVELRRLSDLATIDLLSFCRLELQSEAVFGKGAFESLCAAGRFEFILDGFDEVAKEKRRLVEKQILELAEKYPDCSFLVSGREDDRFVGWGPFIVYDVAPMSLDQVKTLIGKVPFDVKVKKRFLENLSPNFYRQHQSFLSNPLLSIMMLMTFHDNAVIPSKLTTFYSHAFQTLLTWHDATKDSFERHRTLREDQFRRVFSTLCLLSYYQEVFEFTESSLDEYIVRALKYHSIEADVKGVKDDICESVNLIQRDGMKFVFVHRSFQEFFAADCAMKTISGKASEFLTFFARMRRDSVLQMAYEIHPELFIDAYIIPRLAAAEESGIFRHAASKERIITRLNLSFFGMRSNRHATRSPGYVSLNRETDEQLEFFENCSKVSDKDFGPSPATLFRWAGLDAMKEACEEQESLGSKHIAIRFTAQAKDGVLRYSVRNAGTENVPSTVMRAVRSRFVSLMNSKLAAADPRVKDYIMQFAAFLNEKREHRQLQARSIDDILGITN